MRSRRMQRTLRSQLLLSGLVAGFCAGRILVAAEPTFETPSSVRVDRYVSSDQIAGPDWKVEPEAANDGFGNVYAITSRFGSWSERGRSRVLARIQEIRAMAELEKVSKSEVFLDAVKKSVTAPIDLVASAATDPVGTIKAVPGAIGRWFKNTTFKVAETYHDVKEASKQQAAEPEGEESAKADEKDLRDRAKDLAHAEALDYLKITSAERNWYAKLGIDPSTDNEPLRKAITSVARVEGLTSFGMKFVGIPSIPGASEIRKTMQLVWSTDPWELRRLNRKRMLKAGLSETTARAFEDNPALTLTHQTALLDALEQLAGVGGRSTLIARAIDLDSRDEAEQLVASTVLLARFHHLQEPLEEFLAGTRLPVARTAAGNLVAVLLTDAVFWTEPMATAAQGFAETYTGETAPARQLWVAGEASPGFRAGAEKLGWSVRDRWQLSAPEDKAPSGAGPGT